MKKVLLLAVLSLLTVTYISAQKVEKAKKAKTETVVYSVNMDCEGCLNKIKKELTYTKGVKEMHLNLIGKIVAIKFDPSKTDKEKLMATIKKLGYTVTYLQQSEEWIPNSWKETEIVVFLVNMENKEDSHKIMDKLALENSVEKVNLNVDKKLVYIKFYNSKTDKNKLSEIIEKMGYTVTEFQNKKELPSDWK